MSTVKRAFIVTSAQRYVVLAFNFVVFAVIARLLTASEIGAATIGISAMAMCQILRDFGTVPYLVKLAEAPRETVRAAFTVSLVISTTLAMGIALAAPFVATFYGEEVLKPYLWVVAVQLVLGTLYGPIAALLQRDMNFGSLALAEIVATAVGALTTIALAWQGFGALSFAWGGLVQGVTVTAMVLSFRREFWAFRLCHTGWQEILHFGAYTCLGLILFRAFELFSFSVYGRLLSLDALGRYNRATMICDLPLKGVLSGIVPIALPALAAEQRRGRCMKEAFLNGIAFVTVVLWPALVVIALLDQPIVDVLLGTKWDSVEPLIPIIAASVLFSFPSFLTYPILVLTGDVRHTSTVSLITLPLCAVVVFVAAQFGLEAVVWSLLITTPLQNFVALLFMRRCVGFGWGELIGAMKGSAVIALLTAAGPLAVISANGVGGHLSLAAGALGLVGAGIGWLYGLAKLNHPLWPHIRLVAERLLQLLLERMPLAASLPRIAAVRLMRRQPKPETRSGG